MGEPASDDEEGMEAAVDTLEPAPAPTAVATKASKARSLLGSRRILLIAIVVGVALRLVAGLIVGPQGTTLYEFGTIGQNVDSGRGYSFYAVDDRGVVDVDDHQEGRPLPSAFMPPVYTYSVAGALAATSSTDAAIRLLQVLQAFLAGLAIALMYRLGRQLFGPVAGGLAALGYALYPVLIYQTTQTSASNLYLLFEIGALALLLEASRSPRVRWAVALGLTLGVVSLLRAEGLLLVLLAAAWLGWSRRRAGLHAAVACVVVVALGLVLPFAWAARNSVVLDELTPTTTTSGGFNLWIGNAPGASGSQKELPPVPAELRARLRAIEPNASYEVERDHVYLQTAREEMVHHPIATLRRDVTKVLLMVTFDVHDPRARNPVALLAWAVLAVLGVLGIARARMAREHRVLLLGYLALSLLVPAIFFALGRFKLAIEFPLILFAAGYIADRLAARSGADR